MSSASWSGPATASPLYQDKVYLATGDARLVALDARTGKVVWNVVVADHNPGYNYTSGPLIAKGKVIIGISGCTTPDTAGGCFITAHHPGTGWELWRTYTIARPGDPADATWNGMPLSERKGGSLWGTGSYDPELNLVFWGTAPPIPHSQLARGVKDGAFLYTNSTLALDPDTGKIVWHFQHLPSDNWNLDHVFERVLVDVAVDGRLRKMLLTAGKTGIVWPLDRQSGAFLWAAETVPQNVIAGIHPQTGASRSMRRSNRRHSTEITSCARRFTAGGSGKPRPTTPRRGRCTCRWPTCATTTRS
jgi:alcohol dehydrogenase (cytochrome c)